MRSTVTPRFAQRVVAGYGRLESAAVPDEILPGRVLHWTAQAGMSSAMLLSDAMRELENLAQRTGENPACTAGFGAGKLVDALFRGATR